MLPRSPSGRAAAAPPAPARAPAAGAPAPPRQRGRGAGHAGPRPRRGGWDGGRGGPRAQRRRGDGAHRAGSGPRTAAQHGGRRRGGVGAARPGDGGSQQRQAAANARGQNRGGRPTGGARVRGGASFSLPCAPLVEPAGHPGVARRGVLGRLGGGRGLPAQGRGPGLAEPRAGGGRRKGGAGAGPRGPGTKQARRARAGAPPQHIGGGPRAQQGPPRDGAQQSWCQGAGARVLSSAAWIVGCGKAGRRAGDAALGPQPPARALFGWGAGGGGPQRDGWRPPRMEAGGPPGPSSAEALGRPRAARPSAARRGAAASCLGSERQRVPVRSTGQGVWSKQPVESATTEVSWGRALAQEGTTESWEAAWHKRPRRIHHQQQEAPARPHSGSVWWRARAAGGPRFGAARKRVGPRRAGAAAPGGGPVGWGPAPGGRGRSGGGGAGGGCMGSSQN
jgi:hypothetical protein